MRRGFGGPICKQIRTTPRFWAPVVLSASALWFRQVRSGIEIKSAELSVVISRCRRFFDSQLCPAIDLVQYTLGQDNLMLP